MSASRDPGTPQHVCIAGVLHAARVESDPQAFLRSMPTRCYGRLCVDACRWSYATAEAKSCRAYDTYRLLASMVTFRTHATVLLSTVRGCGSSHRQQHKVTARTFITARSMPPALSTAAGNDRASMDKIS